MYICLYIELDVSIQFDDAIQFNLVTTMPMVRVPDTALPMGNCQWSIDDTQCCRGLHPWGGGVGGPPLGSTHSISSFSSMILIPS